MEPTCKYTTRHYNMYGVCRNRVGTLWVPVDRTYSISYISKQDVKTKGTAEYYCAFSPQIGELFEKSNRPFIPFLLFCCNDSRQILNLIKSTDLQGVLPSDQPSGEKNIMHQPISFEQDLAFWADFLFAFRSTGNPHWRSYLILFNARISNI